jgi:hypothetical protein
VNLSLKHPELFAFAGGLSLRRFLRRETSTMNSNPAPADTIGTNGTVDCQICSKAYGSTRVRITNSENQHSSHSKGCFHVHSPQTSFTSPYTSQCHPSEEGHSLANDLHSRGICSSLRRRDPPQLTTLRNTIREGHDFQSCRIEPAWDAASSR